MLLKVRATDEFALQTFSGLQQSEEPELECTSMYRVFIEKNHTIKRKSANLHVGSSFLRCHRSVAKATDCYCE